MSMFTMIFNCPKCKKPFDVVEGEPRAPRYGPAGHRPYCHTCYPKLLPMDRGLIDFLDQPAFKKTDIGYIYTLPISAPVCFGCETMIQVFGGCSAFLSKCGHYLCRACNHRKADERLLCNKCGTWSTGLDCHPESRFAFFSHILKDAQNHELKTRLAEVDAIEAKKNEDRKHGALKNCSECGIEQPVERLYNCNDCQTVKCGSCSFDSHQGHAVNKILGTILVGVEQKKEKWYTETLTGLHGNLKYIQTTIDEAVEKVLVAGKDRLAQMPKRTKYDRAMKIVATVEKAAGDFEKHCEEYIPVARKLATRLTELGEELEKDEE